eukprot:TRINITY_DN872_c3_g1_i2.p1 TRINITY_DN872_c3_g1~~TRINITY_DN872_c3_g1_i2.p1  ORF type:complete len:628 (+),score=166.67 TRINITY_DN872_c3_g1_i2:611-2494(+)
MVLQENSAWITTWFLSQHTPQAQQLFDEMGISEAPFVFQTHSNNFEALSLNNHTLNKLTPGCYYLSRYIAPDIGDCMIMWENMNECITRSLRTRTHTVSFNQVLNARFGDTATKKATLTWIMSFDEEFSQSQSWFVLTPMNVEDGTISKHIDSTTGSSICKLSDSSQDWLARFSRVVATISTEQLRSFGKASDLIFGATGAGSAASVKKACCGSGQMFIPMQDELNTLNTPLLTPLVGYNSNSLYHAQLEDVPRQLNTMYQQTVFGEEPPLKRSRRSRRATAKALQSEEYFGQFHPKTIERNAARQQQQQQQQQQYSNTSPLSEVSSTSTYSDHSANSNNGFNGYHFNNNNSSNSNMSHVGNNVYNPMEASNESNRRFTVIETDGSCSDSYDSPTSSIDNNFQINNNINYNSNNNSHNNNADPSILRNANNGFPVTIDSMNMKINNHDPTKNDYIPATGLIRPSPNITNDNIRVIDERGDANRKQMTADGIGQVDNMLVFNASDITRNRYSKLPNDNLLTRNEFNQVPHSMGEMSMVDSISSSSPNFDDQQWENSSLSGSSISSSIPNIPSSLSTVTNSGSIDTPSFINAFNAEDRPDSQFSTPILGTPLYDNLGGRTPDGFFDLEI